MGYLALILVAGLWFARGALVVGLAVALWGLNEANSALDTANKASSSEEAAKRKLANALVQLDG